MPLSLREIDKKLAQEKRAREAAHKTASERRAWADAAKLTAGENLPPGGFRGRCHVTPTSTGPDLLGVPCRGGVLTDDPDEWAAHMAAHTGTQRLPDKPSVRKWAPARAKDDPARREQIEARRYSWTVDGVEYSGQWWCAAPASSVWVAVDDPYALGARLALLRQRQGVWVMEGQSLPVADQAVAS